MIQIALCDNDIEELEATYELIQEYAELHTEFVFLIRRFQSSYDLMECFDSGKRFDIYFLDVLLSPPDGISAGRVIHASDPDALIVYQTSSPDYAFEAYRLRAFHYLLKPSGSESVFPVLDQLTHLLYQKKREILPVKTKGGITPIHYDQILYVEGRSHVFFYYLANGDIVVSRVMREPFNTVIAPLKKDTSFVKISVSYLVNMYYIQNITGKNLLMSNGVVLPVSRSLYPAFKSAYKNFFT